MSNPRGIREAGRDMYTVDFSEYLPEPLKRDPKMKAFAAAVTEQMLTVSGNIDNVLIYSRIDELPEELVDILAYDMHVDWYDYSFPLNIKRDILKRSVRVHKKMGTKYAVEKALGALYPQSEVEEWYEYEGEPHHFHIVCDVTSNRITASYRDIVNAVKMYKRLSSWMDEVTYQSSIYIKILTHTDYFLYKTPLTGRLLTGTYPQRNTRGAQFGSCIVVGTETAGFIFTSPLTGTLPERNVVFRKSGAQIDVETALNMFGYRNTPTGQLKAGEEPQRSRRGAETKTAVVMEDTTEGFPFRVPAAGTQPDRSTTFHNSVVQIDAETALNMFGYRNTPTGQLKAGEEPQRSHRGAETGAAVVMEGEADGFLFRVPAAGTQPDRSTTQRTEGNAIESTVETNSFRHKSRLCGNTRRL